MGCGVRVRLWGIQIGLELCLVVGIVLGYKYMNSGLQGIHIALGLVLGVGECQGRRTWVLGCGYLHRFRVRVRDRDSWGTST